MAERLTTLTDEFQKLLRHPFTQDFLQFMRYCCNQKIMHLLRHLEPQILDSAQRFDYIIDQLTDDYYDLSLQSQALFLMQDIESNLPSLSGAHMAQLAQVQLCSLPKDGELDLLSMRATAIPAFYAAHLLHLSQLLQEGVPGPYLSPVF
jgi:hypothetical protein